MVKVPHAEHAFSNGVHRKRPTGVLETWTDVPCNTGGGVSTCEGARARSWGRGRGRVSGCGGRSPRPLGGKLSQAETRRELAGDGGRFRFVSTSFCCVVGGHTLLRAPSSHRVDFGRCSPSTTSTTPRTSPFSSPQWPLVSVSSRSRRIRKLLPQLCVCVSRLVTMVCIWCSRSLGRLNFLDLLLRHNALVGGHPGPRKKADEHSSTR